MKVAQFGVACFKDGVDYMIAETGVHRWLAPERWWESDLTVHRLLWYHYWIKGYSDTSSGNLADRKRRLKILALEQPLEWLLVGNEHLSVDKPRRSPQQLLGANAWEGHRCHWSCTIEVQVTWVSPTQKLLGPVLNFLMVPLVSHIYYLH